MCSTIKALRKLKNGTLLLILLLFTSQASAYNFYANYEVLFNGADYFAGDTYPHFVIKTARMSGDGSRIAFAGGRFIDGGTTVDYKLFIVDFDGDNLVEIPLPTDTEIADIAINDDGSRFFFNTPWYQGKIFKVDITENPVIAQLTEIIDLTTVPGSADFTMPIRTTASGDWIYFTKRHDYTGGGGILRLPHTGVGVVEVVVDDTKVPVAGGNTGWEVERFDLSDDGNTIVFSLEGYRTSSGTLNNRRGWFSKTATGFHQLTPTDKFGLSQGLISGNGAKIVFTDYSNEYQYILVDADGSNRVEFQDRGYNNVGAVLTYDGSRMFYADHLAVTGRITHTDGSGGMYPLPSHDVNAIAVDVDAFPQISNNATRVSFVNNSQLYAGIFNPDIHWTSKAPSIPTMNFDPLYMYEDAAAEVVLTTQPISKAADIYRISIDNIYKGKYYRWYDLSYGFQRHPVDTGTGPDLVADDGVFSSVAAKSANYTGPETYSVVAHLGVMDALGNLTVADRTLWRSTPDPVCTEPGLVLSNFTSTYIAPLCSSSDLISFISTTIMGGTFLTIRSPITILSNDFSVKAGATLRIYPPGS